MEREKCVPKIYSTKEFFCIPWEFLSQKLQRISQELRIPQNSLTLFQEFLKKLFLRISLRIPRNSLRSFPSENFIWIENAELFQEHLNVSRILPEVSPLDNFIRIENSTGFFEILYNSIVQILIEPLLVNGIKEWKNSNSDKNTHFFTS